MTVRRRISCAATGLAVAGLGLWWVTAPTRPAGTLARIQREGVIRIGYAVEPPYAFLNAQGQLTGGEVEAAGIVAARLAIPRIEWCQTEFGSLLAELDAGRFDVVAAGMFITAERARRASFSEPTFRVRQALLVQSGNPHGFHSYHDVLEHPGIQIAVLHGSIEEELIRQMGVTDAQVAVVPDALTGRVAVESGLVGGLALSSPAVRFMTRQHALGLTEVAQPFASPDGAGGRLTGFGAVVFRQRDDDLRQAWNRELGIWVGSPEHRRLLSAFGFTDDELPSGVTTAQVLSSIGR